MSLLRKTLSTRTVGLWHDLALLMLRLGLGGSMLLNHGWGKFTHFNDMLQKFPDPLGLGVKTSLLLTVMAEFFCSGLVVLGLLTRVGAFFVAFTMATAFLVVQAGAPFSEKELAFLYGLGFVAILIQGGGRFSVDARLQG